MPSPIAQLIYGTIARRGVISFEELMNLALYHPEHGYYVQPRTRTGKAGDFFTNVSVGAVYGQVLADQFAAMHVALGSPPRFTILEQGIEDGRLARDILERLQGSAPAVYAAAEYLVVEPYPPKERSQRDQLEGFGPKVKWASSLRQVQPFTGVVHAHELVDAFPVHLVERFADCWRELGVTLKGDRLAYAPLPELSPGLADHLKRIPTPPGDQSYRTEVNLAGPNWIRDVSRVLACGFVLILDYGFSRDVYYAAHRRDGTLACYHRHRKDHDPLSSLGEKDITAHVDFTSLAEAAAGSGLEVAGFTDQHHFMVGAAEERLRRLDAGGVPRPGADEEKFLHGLQTLLHPAHLGAVFRYLLLTRPRLPAPPGFRYSREPHRELGLPLPT